MRPSTALLLYNAPLLFHEDTPEALAERGVLEAVEAVGAVLEARGLDVRRWALTPTAISGFVQSIGEYPPSLVVVNLFEGFSLGSDQESAVAMLLEELGVLYTGNGPAALETCRRKELCGQKLRAAGIATPSEWLLSGGVEELLSEDLPWPLILKPAWEDGSVGISPRSVVASPEALKRQVAETRLRMNGSPLLVQEFIKGREFAVSLMGPGPLETLAVSEMDFSGLPEGYPAIVSGEAKWCEESPAYRGTAPRCPASLEPGLEEALRGVAEAAQEVLELRDYARVDVRLREGKPVVIDVNPNPDLAPTAGFARSAQAVGLEYDELILRLLEYALGRNHA